MTSSKFIQKLLTFAILLTFCVILLGAFTRLTDAGLGCPDWPGCYGQLTVPQAIGSNNYGASWEFNSTKAWTEMIHRYLAGSLGILIVIISSTAIITNIRNNKSSFKANALPILLVVVLIAQAVLGMLTVTLKLLPTIVMGHLIMGLVTLCLLVVILLNSFNFKKTIKFNKNIKILAGITFIVLFIQIMLGGWTSSNYAALPCLDFPSCNGQYLPSAGTLNAMNPMVSIGPNYEGGLLSYQMRVTIQLFHRWGALITTLMILLTSIKIRKYQSSYYKKFSVFLITMLLLQITIGIINVKWALPLITAVLHNGIAALLLVALLVLNYKITFENIRH
jgi:cytochrome c oxidase assembly protein subunit 15